MTYLTNSKKSLKLIKSLKYKVSLNLWKKSESLNDHEHLFLSDLRLEEVKVRKIFRVNFNKGLRNQIMQQGIVKIYKFPGLILNMRKRAINTLL